MVNPDRLPLKSQFLKTTAYISRCPNRITVTYRFFFVEKPDFAIDYHSFLECPIAPSGSRPQFHIKIETPICGHTKLGYPRGRILEPLKEAVLRNLAHRPGLSPNQSHFWCLILGRFSVQKYHNQKQSILEEYIYIYQYNSRIWRYFCTQTDSCL